MARPGIELKKSRNRPQLAGERNHGGKQGFTLVELLVVLAILAVLAAVAVTSIAGAFQRGGEQAYYADRQTLQSAVHLFLYDGHVCDTEPPGDSWDSTQSPVFGHYYPTSTGKAPSKIIYEILEDANAVGSVYTFPTEAIWMGLLYNSPAAVSTHDRDGAAPLLGEMGPYINKVPESASSNNYSASSGAYTWVIDYYGIAYGVYWDGSSWQQGFSGTYP
jgi:prepilin-type N-terminal cleavage/methylation domain-containing protein